MLVTQSELARRAGVLPVRISDLMKGRLKGAVQGKRIDDQHPEVKKYLRDRKVVLNVAEQVAQACAVADDYSTEFIRTLSGCDNATALAVHASIRPRKGVRRTPEPAHKEPNLGGWSARKETMKAEGGDVDLEGLPEHLVDLADWTLRDLIGKFGTDVRFVDWLKATKELEMIEKQRIANAAAEGRLVSRELVKAGVIDVFETAHMNLLSDGAKTIAMRATTMRDAGKSEDDIRKKAVEVIGSHVRAAKDKAIRALRRKGAIECEIPEE
jgi:hypothetical protein